MTVKGKKIAILNFAEIEFSIAGERCGGANPLKPVQNYYQIIEAKKQADIVLVIVHGGVEKSSLPSPDFVETLHFFADLGVSAVIAPHSHCAGGIEMHNDVPIFYSLGNFLFDRVNKYKGWYKSYFIRMTFVENNVGKIQIIPYFQFKNNNGLQLMQKEDKQKFLSEIADLSNIIKNRESLKENWNRLCKEKRARYLLIAMSLNKYIRFLLNLKIIRTFFLKKEKMLLLLNMYRCPSHREVMIGVLEKEINSEIKV